MKIPSLILKQLYTFGSLENFDRHLRFGLKNRLSDVTLTALEGVTVDEAEIDRERLTLHLDDGHSLSAGEVSPESPLDFPLRKMV